MRILAGRARHRRGHPGAGRDRPTAQREWTTVGVHENVVEASWQALVDALTYAAVAFDLSTRNPEGTVRTTDVGDRLAALAGG